MSSNHPPRLSFDVLGVVFAEYAKEETIKKPLETLLLVCRAWHNAALGHRNLWGRMRIHLSHEPSATIWTKRLPLRLARGGPGTPLHIDIRGLDEEDECSASERFPCPSYGASLFGSCECDAAAKTCAELSLQTLAGKGGEASARWVTVVLDFRHNEDNLPITTGLANALSYPTPNLTTLELTNLHLPMNNEVPLFPDAPRLEQIQVIDCLLPNLPNLENVRLAAVGWTDMQNRYQDFSGFRNATRLQNLTLRPSFEAEIPIPAQLTELHTLQIIGDNLPDDMVHCQMPQLSQLRLEFQDGTVFEHIFRCRGLPLERLNRITLHWDLFGSDNLLTGDAMYIRGCISQLLMLTKNLECLSADSNILSIIVRELWELKSDNYPSSVFPSEETTQHGSLVNLSRKSVVDIPRNPSANFFEELATEWALVPPDLPEEDFYIELMVGFDSQISTDADVPKAL